MDPVILPPEWAPQGFVLLAWPHPDGDFAPWLEVVEHSYALTVVAVSRHQDVLIACRDRQHQRDIQERLEPYHPVAARVRFVHLPYRDVWVRDTAPIGVWHRPGPAQGARLLDFRFNGWGNKYPHQADDRFGQALYRAGIFGDIPCQRIDWVLEGGSLETDGLGTLLATRRSIQNPNRNPDPLEAETVLRHHLGLKRFLWLDHGCLPGDDTDGHIDTLARFCDHDTIVYQGCDDPDDPRFSSLRRMAVQLETFRTPFGRPYELVALPAPRPIFNRDGRPLPASYANFLIINGAVLVPQYEDAADGQALACLRKVFPHREIIPIPARGLIQQYGSLHCMSMNYPLPIELTVQP